MSAETHMEGAAGERKSTMSALHALGDARCAFVNIHTARPGCLLSRVERIIG
jgi:hypothetical protein